MPRPCTSREDDRSRLGTGEIGISEDGLTRNEIAARSQMPHDQPTEHEFDFFSELHESNAAVETYLRIRNTALSCWFTNQATECTAEDVVELLDSPYDTEIELIDKVVNYLGRYCKINFGHYTRMNAIKRPLAQNQRLVVVIGAGAAGIAAATQLRTFGFDVIIVEGRNRMGGRAQTILSQNGMVMELGCDVLRNAQNSPLVTLMHQVKVHMAESFKYNWIYRDGKPLAGGKDTLLPRMYGHICEAIKWLAHESPEKHEENGLYPSRQQAHENIINMLERHSLMRYYNYAKAAEETAKKMEEHYKQLNHFRKVALMSEKKIETLPADADDLLRRSLNHDLENALKKFDQHLAGFELCQNHQSTHKKYAMSKQYMHPKDYQIHNFLLGFEEFIYGAQLEKVQFSCNTHTTYDQGSTIRLQAGYQDMLEQIAKRQKLDIRLNYKVMDIDSNSPDHIGVTVVASDGEVIELYPSYVVSTLPIGVLKKTIKKDPIAPTFSPSLSEEKVKAIRNIGNALVNKIILIFDKPFWYAMDRYEFCNVSPSAQSRAYMTVWSSYPGSSALTTYIVGALEIHDFTDIDLVNEAMGHLRKIFPEGCPKYPTSFQCTRWHTDEFAFGSGSFMNLRTEKEDYETLLQPIKTSDGKNRVYFAGEHTSLEHSNTIEGAWMSGLRAATDMANDHAPLEYTKKPKRCQPSTSRPSGPKSQQVAYKSMALKKPKDD